MAFTLNFLKKLKVMFVIIAATILVVILVVLFFVNRAPKNSDNKSDKMK